MTDDIEAILQERGKTHGPFPVHASVAQLIKDALASAGSDRLSPVQKESLDMIAHKMGRIVAGDPDHADHWDDIAGYAKLASKELQPKLNPAQDWSRTSISTAAEAQMRAAYSDPNFYDADGNLRPRLRTTVQVPGLSEQAKADLDYLDRHGLPGSRRVVEPPSMAEMRAAADYRPDDRHGSTEPRDRD